MSLVAPASGLDVDWVRFVATLVLGAGTLSLLLVALGAAPRSAACASPTSSPIGDER
jgi:hypothetical protein